MIRVSGLDSNPALVQRTTAAEVMSVLTFFVSTFLVVFFFEFFFVFFFREEISGNVAFSRGGPFFVCSAAEVDPTSPLLLQHCKTSVTARVVDRR